MKQSRVNLYSSQLLPPKKELAFSQLVMMTSVLLLLSMLVIVSSYLDVRYLQNKKQVVMQKKQQVDAKNKELIAKVAAHKPDPELIKQVEELTLQLSLKRLLIKSLNDLAPLTRLKFAPVLKDLATIADSSVWLSRIVIEEQGFMFEGAAQDPQSIPLWVSQLKTASSFKGYAFSAMTIDRGENKPLTFTLTSNEEQEERQ